MHTNYTIISEVLINIISIFYLKTQTLMLIFLFQFLCNKIEITYRNIH